MAVPIVIPPGQLAADTLRNLAQEYVTRDGTDYGAEEVNLQSRTEQVLQQIRTGRVLIVFDDESQSCNLLTAEQVRHLLPGFREGEHI